jgi:hypothetical protein
MMMAGFDLPQQTVLENPPTAKSLYVGAVDRLRLILNRLAYLSIPI